MNIDLDQLIYMGGGIAAFVEVVKVFLAHFQFSGRGRLIIVTLVALTASLLVAAVNADATVIFRAWRPTMFISAELLDALDTVVFAFVLFGFNLFGDQFLDIIGGLDTLLSPWKKTAAQAALPTPPAENDMELFGNEHMGGAKYPDTDWGGKPIVMDESVQG